MKTHKTIWAASALLLFVLCLAPFAVAQGGDPFEINGDVDNDGMVDIRDIQQVVNDALGLNERGADAINRPVRQYIVASPRASLAPRPGTDGGAEEPCSVIGSATNFERPNGRLLVRAGTGIVFRYDRNVEGVWHENACGLLRSELIVHVLPIDPDADLPTIFAETEPSDWTLVGEDGASARRCGPAIATANIGVRSRFEEAGDFLVRCAIRTYAIPESEIVEEGETPDFCGAARDVDVVFTHLRVVDRDATRDDIDWEAIEESSSVGHRFGDRLQNGEGDGVALP